jgi:prepilin-type N-terminal cleavage/methylation domain-containing protein
MIMKRNREKGFTLIEIIVSLVLLGIVALIAGMGFVTVIRGYVFAKMNAEMVEKEQTAITRMVKELGDCTVTAGTGTSVTFTRPNDATAYTFSWGGAGNPLILSDSTGNTDTLTDRVNNFTLAYYNNSGAITTAALASQVEITLRLISYDNMIQTFTNRVYTKVQ